ncbi:hypothetical protein [Hyphomicrobium sp. MC1]|uniref:hypothetical protein n=1 Tax=Hyphomicrobium sp. (strain MC1) TaxID=717785 RepID=UPI000213D618|nr:hypothetical protein [Hyphomicrobium sp. MC1]CCB66863.1 conserved protein of unknown function [Hyphomicrobium sp. MC1]
MTIGQLVEMLSTMPKDAVVLIENGVGLSSIGALEFIDSQGLGAPAEVILQPSNDE